MSRQIGMLVKPTLEECKAAAKAKGMPEREGEKLFVHYEMTGWKYGKGKVPISSLALAMQNWYLGWEERGYPGGEQNGHAPLTGMQLKIKEGEYERTLARMKQLTDSVESHSSMRREEREEYIRLRKNRDELRKILGITI